MTQVAILDLIAPVAQRVPRCPTPVLVQAYTDAVRQLCAKSRWYKATLPGATVADIQLYSLGSDVYNEIIGIKAMSVNNGIKYVPVTESFSGNWDASLDPALPELYQYVPHGQFALHPTPDAIYPLTVSIVLQPKRGSNSVDDSLVVSWDYAFQAGALSYILKLPSQPWTDKQEANTQLLIFRDWMERAGSHEQRAYNPGAQVTDRLGQPNAAAHSKILPI